MAISEITEKLLAAKKANGITFEDLEKIVGRDETWIASVIYRQASADADAADDAGQKEKEKKQVHDNAQR